MISVTLNITYKGQHLIDALKKVSQNPVVLENDTLFLNKTFSLGQTSCRLYEQIAILADENSHVYPETYYHTFTVTEGHWEDADGTEYTPLDVVDYMLNFTRNLYLELLGQGGTPNPFDQANSNSFVKEANFGSVGP